jgi:hypothetical protein
MIHQMEKYITGIAICLVVCFLLNIEGENVLVPTYFARKYKMGAMLTQLLNRIGSKFRANPVHCYYRIQTIVTQY